MSKYGACIWSLPGSTILEKIQLASDCGLDGVQLDLGLPEDGYSLVQDSTIKELVDYREETGLAYPAIGLNVFCYHSVNDPAKGSLLRESVQAALKVAEVLGVSILQIPSFGASEIHSDKDLENTAGLFSFACELGSDKGITIASENVLLPDQLDILIQKVNAPNFGIYFDTANPKAMLGLDAIPFLDASFDRLVQLHLKDSRSDNVPVLLGEGDTDFHKVYDHIRERGYDDWFILESPYDSLTKAGRNPVDLLKADLATAKARSS